MKAHILVCAAAIITTAVAVQAQTQTRGTIQSPNLRQAPERVTLQNGQVAFKASSTAPERAKIEFETPPQTLLVVWKNPQTFGSAQRIEVVRRSPNGGETVVATHPFNVSGARSDRTINLPLRSYLPAYNTTGGAISYEVRIVTTQAGNTARRSSATATITHVARGSIEEPRLFSYNPFSCPKNTVAPRKATIAIAGFKALTRIDSNIGGTNTRDESFFFTEFVARNDQGPAPVFSSGMKRTPEGKSSYYATYTNIQYGPTFNLNGNTPTNDRPVLWDGTLAHDTGLHLRVFMRELDSKGNKAGGWISADVIEEMNRIRSRANGAAAASPESTGLAGIAEMANAVGQTLPFSNSSTDGAHRAVFDVIVENVCGQLKYMVIGLRDHTEDGTYFDFQFTPAPTRFSIYEASLGAVAFDTFDFKTAQQVWPAPFAFRGDEAITTIFAKRGSRETQIEVAVSVSKP